MPDLNGRKVKIVWADVCKKRSEGGLGLRRLKEMNVVLVLKLIWRILSANSLWVDWVKVFLIQKGSFWQVKEQSSRGSWIWEKLLKYRDTAKSFHRMIAGNGVRVSFWFDHWCELGRLWYHLGSRGVIHMGISRHAMLADIPFPRRRRKSHKIQLLNEVERELGSLCLSNREDVSVWRTSNDKFKPVFSTKDTWEQMREIKPKVGWSSGVWFKYATPKMSFILWVAILNRLSTGDRMGKLKGGVHMDCVFCLKEVETVSHLFFECEFSESVWSATIKGVLGRKYTANWVELLSLISKDHKDNVHEFLLNYAFQASVYLVWRERNRRKHGEKPMPKKSLVLAIDSAVKNRLFSIADPVLNGASLKWLESKFV